MRKVIYRKWEGTPYNGEWGVFTYEGLFHQWGSNCMKGENGFGNYTVALVENPDGTISEVLPQNIKFIL